MILKPFFISIHHESIFKVWRTENWLSETVSVQGASKVWSFGKFENLLQLISSEHLQNYARCLLIFPAAGTTCEAMKVNELDILRRRITNWSITHVEVTSFCPGSLSRKCLTRILPRQGQNRFCTSVPAKSWTSSWFWTFLSFRTVGASTDVSFLLYGWQAECQFKYWYVTSLVKCPVPLLR